MGEGVFIKTKKKNQKKKQMMRKSNALRLWALGLSVGHWGGVYVEMLRAWFSLKARYNHIRCDCESNMDNKNVIKLYIFMIL